MNDRLLSLVDGVVDLDEPRLPLLTLREAQAAIELLRLLAAGNGEGAHAARHLARSLVRRLPSEQ
ncbi:hypothetical protein MOV08_39805 [Streptomyces yunnanensis]|uniref:Uncharacterized protein n=1 Tax=Streptomyces yunnanensis TaxID=156453 RepID=A0ABY8AIH7_9ACTN|nr:hypothetical protein [Streptomyces yunnanensis]WEB44828.1 hypothetical protein MOV08_39805 [Streptomyces yunnanensis]